VQLVGRGELVGLGDRGDEDDLVLLGHHADCRALGRGQGAGQEVHVLAQDQLPAHPDRLVGVALGVAGEQLELAAQDAPLGIDLLHEHLGALERRLAEQRAGAGQDHREADLDGLLGRARRRRQQGRRGQDGHDQEDGASVHACSPQKSGCPGTAVRIR
jgi:hypothetical protein